MNGCSSEHETNRNCDVNKIPMGVDQSSEETCLQLAEMWKAVLRVDDINPEDDFFELGGHSLQMIALAEDINRKWNIDMNATDVFAEPVLKQMAALIDQLRAGYDSATSSAQHGLIVLREHVGAQAVFITVGGNGHASAFTKYMALADRLGDGYSVYGLPDTQVMHGAQPKENLDGLIREWVDHILPRCNYGPCILIGECSGGYDSIAIAGALHASGKDDIRVILLDTKDPGVLKNKVVFDEGSDDPPVHIPARKPIHPLRIRLERFTHRYFPAIGRLFENPGSHMSNLRIVRQYKIFDPGWYLHMHADVRLSGIDPLLQYMNTGWIEKRHPSPLFPVFAYHLIVPGFRPDQCDHVTHFLMVGRFDPTIRSQVQKLIALMEDLPELVRKYGLFDEDWYRLHNPDLMALENGYFHHYFHFGWQEGRAPSPDFNAEILACIDPYFNRELHHPILHFLLIGREDPDISKQVLALRGFGASLPGLMQEYSLFDADWYLLHNPDLRETENDPCHHYLHFGWQEGRAPSPDFNEMIYEMLHPAFNRHHDHPVFHFLFIGRQDAETLEQVRALRGFGHAMSLDAETLHLFDAQWYAAQYSDLSDSLEDAFHHYMHFGWQENRHPSAFFNKHNYQLIEPDFKFNRENPILHYMLKGSKKPDVQLQVRGLYLSPSQRRSILSHGLFDEDWYLTQYPSVRQYGHDPLVHYHTIGWQLGRQPFAGSAGHDSWLRQMASLRQEADGRHASLMTIGADGSGGQAREDAAPDQPLQQVADREKLTHAEQEEALIRARGVLRQNHLRKVSFPGDVHLVLNTVYLRTELDDALLGSVKGKIYTYPTGGDHESYLWEDLPQAIEVIQTILMTQANDPARAAGSSKIHLSGPITGIDRKKFDPSGRF